MTHAALKLLDEAEQFPPVARPAASVSPFAHPGTPAGVTGDLVRGICELRRKRDGMFPARLFGDPTWDMLLQLYAARLELHRLSITRLTKLAGVPATTVLRRLGVLEKEGLVTRSTDPYDGRRVYVALSPAGAEAMDGCFAASGLRAMFL